VKFTELDISSQLRKAPTTQAPTHTSSTYTSPTHAEETNLQDPDEDKVRQRAYEIYLERGAVAGFEVEDWLQAESEVLDAPNFKKAA
jgi:Protein of unknown function (DUF2934)